MAVTSFIINRKRWKFKQEYLPDYIKDGVVHERHGLCDCPEDTNKAIRIQRKLKGLLELETIIHEVRHAENWDMYDELYVDRISHDLASLLWRLGYRKTTPET